MWRFWWVLFLLWAVLCQVGQSQRRRQIMNYASYSPVAQDRRSHWIKYLKKQERQKFRHFKRYFKKCGFSPFKFKVFRRSDDGDLDMIHVVVPYGFADEYFPKPEVDEEEVVPVEYYTKQTTTKPMYSVKYRSVGEDNSFYDNRKNGTTVSNSGGYLTMG